MQAETGTQILNRKLSVLLDNSSSQSTKNGRIIPHPSQLRDYVSGFSMEETDRTFLSISKEILLLLLKQKLIPRKLKITFDFYKELYYKKKDNPHVIGTKAEKGTNKLTFGIRVPSF